MDDRFTQVTGPGTGPAGMSRRRVAWVTVLAAGGLVVAGCTRTPATATVGHEDHLPARILLPAGCEYEALCPDGQWVVADCAPHGPTPATAAGLWVGTTTGNEWHMLASIDELGGGAPAAAQWSPDGSMLVWGQVRGPLTLVLQGRWSEKRVLHPRYMGIQGQPRWAPDGSKLAVAGLESGTALALLLPDGTSRVLVSDEEVMQPPDVDFGPAWSPDGLQLAYLGLPDEGDPTQRQLWVTDVDTGQRRMVLETREPLAEPAWSPDGRSIALLRPWDAIFIFDVRSGTLRRLGLPAEATEVQGQVWSPDGSRLALETHSGVWAVDVSSGSATRVTTEPANIVRWTGDGRNILLRQREADRDAVETVPAAS